MSAFDDEFGLFGEETEEVERRPTLGARKIGGANETIIDEIELDEPRRTVTPRNDAQPRGDAQPRFEGTPAGAGAPRYDRRRRDDRPSYGDRPQRRRNADPQDPWAGHRRASVMLDFLAKKLVTEPEKVAVELFLDEAQQPVIELVVAPDDLGKVIGRNGRVAHALRTLVRATAESRVSVDIMNTEEAGDDAADDANEE
jgi:predicted RNA-binding protein YlqC (UPF0109 family)